ncbi:hypothetical protein CABS01_03143 [Colletotrichum abscissum]|uniref:SnoaL-like domain-containing protein n=1 Tax=Colletotrichum abscissum TaxID=1671311 RepID=A0A9P9X7N3_9PEZI|nr:uncharacterized protein CABS01_03143 [Colletotrichum abscissum]KAI3540741.1 hypothetical protein CABS02_10957 [Colletotrichum abscissum]KAK1477841.1 hypothetical protein CABS01_03143 [Colletotrichum abscissum]
MATTPSSSDLRKVIEATAETFLASFEDGSVQNDPAIINRTLTPDCTRHILPSSVSEVLGLPANFSIDNVTFQKVFAKDIKALKFRNGIISNLVIDTEARRAAFTSIFDVVVVGSGEKFASEASFTLYFNENGSKITKVIEFLEKDSTVRMAGVHKENVPNIN